MKTSSRFIIAIILILLSLPFAKVMAQQTPVKDVYIDNNKMITISFLSDSPAAHGLLRDVIVPLDTTAVKVANVAFHYPLSGRVDVTTENGQYRITVYNLYFDAAGLALPVEAFAIRGKKLTKNSKDLKSVILLHDFLKSYLVKL